MHTSRDALSALHMLTARSDFVDAHKKGKKWVSQSLVLQIKKNHQGIIRVGYTVSKKVHKSAVKRNRVKRRLRAAAADMLTRYAPVGYDYVIIGRRETLSKEYRTLAKDLKWCMKRMDVYVQQDGKAG